jgi:ferric-dicitrate binding protein FerR (iron transport regulator)
MRRKPNNTGFELTPAESELEATLARVALPAPRVDLCRAAFDAGRRATFRFTQRCILAAAGVLLLIGGFAISGMHFRDRGLLQGLPTAMSVRQVEGAALVKHEGSSTWEEIGGNGAQLFVGDTLLCSSGASLLLGLPDNSRVALAANSRLTLAHENGGLELSLAHGKVTADLTSPHPPFVINTPQGRIRALGTTFTVIVNERD